VCVLPVLSYAIQSWNSCWLGLQGSLVAMNSKCHIDSEMLCLFGWPVDTGEPSSSSWAGTGTGVAWRF